MTPTDQQQTSLRYDFADPWVPQDGDVLEGTVASIDSSPPGQYGAYPIVTLTKPDGESLAVHAFHHTLRTALARAKPKVGDLVGVKYLGKVEPKGDGHAYHNYRVVTQGGGFDWDADAAAAQQAPAPEDDDTPF